jgi:hypothetical protein
MLGSPANLYLFDLIANAKNLVGKADIAGADAVAASFAGGAAVIIGCCVAFLDADQKGATGTSTPNGMRLDELLRLIQKKVGITAFTDVLESFASDRHFMKAGKQSGGATPRGAAGDDDGLDKIEDTALYDKEFRRFYHNVVALANKAIMGSYSGSGEGGEEHAGMGGGGEGGVTAAFQEIIRKQDKELQELKGQLQRQKSGSAKSDETDGEQLEFDAQAEANGASSEGGGALRRVEAGLAKRGAEHAEKRREEEEARRVEVEKEKVGLEHEQVQLRRKVAVLEQELSAARSGEQQTAGAKDGLESKLSEAIAAKEAAEEERRALSMSVASLEMEVKLKQMEKEAADSRAEMYEAQLKAEGSSGAAAASALGDGQDELMAKAEAAAAAKVAAIEFELDSSKKAVEAMKIRCEELEAELKTAREGERAREQQVRDQQQLVGAAEQVASEEKAEKVGVEAEVEELRRQLQERDTQLGMERARAKEVEKEAAEERRRAVECGEASAGGGADMQRLRDEVTRLKQELERRPQSGAAVQANASSGNAGASSAEELTQLRLAQQELEEEHADLLVLLASQEIEKSYLATHLTKAVGVAATTAALAEAYSNGAINFGGDSEGGGSSEEVAAGTPPAAPTPATSPAPAAQAFAPHAPVGLQV